MQVRVLVVDGANVVGSVPDGWWRDRPGAAARLHAGLVDALAAGALTYDVVELVLEGKARAGVAAGSEGVLVTVHAPGEGDDEIVRRCADHAGAGSVVTLASADRGLLARVAPWCVDTLGPRTLRAQLRRP